MLAGCGVAPRLPASATAAVAPATPDCPRAAFDVHVSANGRVEFEAAHLLAIEPTGAGDLGTVQRLHRTLADLDWQPAVDAHGRPRAAAARVWVNCAAQVQVARAAEPAIARALQARQHAAASWSNGAAPRRPQAELDIVWTHVATFMERSPFFYDDLDPDPRAASGSPWLEALRRADGRDGGFWLVRRQRHTHDGDFVFMDSRHRIIARAAYRIGE